MNVHLVKRFSHLFMNLEKLESLGFAKAVRACNIHYRALARDKSRPKHGELLKQCDDVAQKLFKENKHGEKELWQAGIGSC